ncbi:hypothetical protein BVRB_5g118800 [Beta vulgaris subsp. vulgaris]|nr:hypothetical protein BVRB_5g118800 [Beta vulgaris subsp. vulgaris]
MKRKGRKRSLRERFWNLLMTWALAEMIGDMSINKRMILEKDM